MQGDVDRCGVPAADLPLRVGLHARALVVSDTVSTLFLVLQRRVLSRCTRKSEEVMLQRHSGRGRVEAMKKGKEGWEGERQRKGGT
eukprot:2541341-Rhodomonas_salina.2